MSITEEADLMRQVPIFSQADPARLKLLAFASDRKQYPAGSLLFDEGDAGDSAYLVLSGEVEILVNVGSRFDRIAVQQAGQLVGEAAILTSRARSARVRTMCETVCLCIGKDEFMDFLEQNPAVAIAVASSLSEKLAGTTLVLQQQMQRGGSGSQPGSE